MDERAELKLEDYRWSNRVLLIIADDMTDSDYQKAIEILKKRRSEIEERDMITILITGQHLVGVDQAAAQVMDTKAAMEFLGQGPAGCRTVLIGKDGGVKLDRAGSPDLEEIFALVDSMPMRRREMRERQP
jgi:hypothetical protein